MPPVVSKLDAPLPRLPGPGPRHGRSRGLDPGGASPALNGENATKQAIRTATTGKAVLHFATHAIVQRRRSVRLLSGGYPDAGTPGIASSDGLLTAREIYELNLDADLVVLSACRSAGGRVRGDGIATFARAFIYAGTPSLIASVWDVADQPANRLLPDFYRTWLGGATKARALRARNCGCCASCGRAGCRSIRRSAGSGSPSTRSSGPGSRCLASHSFSSRSP